MENNLTEIAANLAKSLEPFKDAMAGLDAVIKKELENNKDLAKEYAAALKDADLKKRFDDLQKELKSINHTFRK